MTNNEFFNKIEFLRKILKKNNKDGIIVSKYENLSWLGIKRPNVLSLSEGTILKLVITLDKVILLTNNIEMERLLEEEISPEITRNFTLEEYPWYIDVKEIIAEKYSGFAQDSELEKDIKRYRMVLTKSEQETAVSLGRDISEILKDTLKYVEIGKTEREISAIMQKMCVEKKIDIGLALCAADERIYKYRHPLSTDKKIEKLCLLALTVRREGIYTCISRMVSFGTPDEEVLRKRDAVLKVDCAYYEMTEEGAPLDEIYAEVKYIYEENGFADEWENHHQGGVTGYLGREYKISQNTKEYVQDGMMFAYNPTVAGYKTEDTFFLSGNDKIITTDTSDLPMIEIEFNDKKYIKPDIIVL